MSEQEDRNALEVLKAELDFLEKGGYGRSVREPKRASSVFQDSPTCLCYPDRKHEDCCFLMQLVPAERRSESIPCHHIPLNSKGETISSFEDREDQQGLEEAVRDWVKKTIAEIEGKAPQVRH